MTNDAIQDLSVITTFPYHTLKGIFSKLEDVISYNFQESLLNSQDFCELDIGIGKLIIGVDEEVKIKFIPSSSLENDIVQVLEGKECSLVSNVEESIKNRIIGAYKDLY